ncbi:UNVERIFIED_ORG: hypothetical protein JN05_02756 [Zoogloea ramigera]|uniref:Cellulose biosynthesis protein BcsS n=1 Tax=Duganella zoogloeoides TaxID=75659 RepID=A0ABZ0XW69_9BURK|nr:hypothetical protein [Duganella zoogloeoides]WQH03365.1 hypothetical protein SR858_20250 [Duganella zoogloeoides]
MNKLSMVITVAGWSCCGAAAAGDTPLPLLVQPSEARADFRPLLADRNRRYSSIAEFETHMGRAVGAVTAGILRETGPGAERNTALALRARPTTAFTSLSMGYSVTPRSSVMAMATYGKTDGYGSPDSLMAQVSSVRTMAFSVGWSTREIFDNRDRIGITVSVPAKVRTGVQQGSGQAAYMGSQAFGAPALNLQPTATERDIEFGYSTTVGGSRDGRGGKVTGAVMLRFNPGHDANAAPDWLAGVRYSHGF